MSVGQDVLLRWTAPEGPWTEPDLHHFPQDGHRYEIIDGCLHAAPPVDATHELIATALVSTLRSSAPPGWWPCGRLGVQIGASYVVADAAVLRPGSSGTVWADPRDVALVVEVETPATRRLDRLLKPALYAEAGIEEFWRVERDAGLAVAYLHRLTPDGVYRLETVARAGERVVVEQPYAVPVDPATWTR